jgi:hypothetical protein
MRAAEANHPTRLSAPAVSVQAVDPSSGVDLPDGVCKSLYVGTGGHVEIVAENDLTPHIWKNVPDGGYVICRVKQVLAAGTTATDILALY